jgi:hypothetical protein
MLFPAAAKTHDEVPQCKKRAAATLREFDELYAGGFEIDRAENGRICDESALHDAGHGGGE